MNYSSLYIFCSNFRLSVLIYGIIHPGCFHIYHFFSRPNILDQHLRCSGNKISFKNNNRSQRELFHTKKQEIRGSLVPKRHFKVFSSSMIKVWEVQGSFSKYLKKACKLGRCDSNLRDLKLSITHWLTHWPTDCHI